MMMPKTNIKLKYNNSVAEVCINTSVYIFIGIESYSYKYFHNYYCTTKPTK